MEINRIKLEHLLAGTEELKSKHIGRRGSSADFGYRLIPVGETREIRANYMSRPRIGDSKRLAEQLEQLRN